MEKPASSFRSAIQDPLVPELKAIQVELKHHSEQFESIDRRFGLLDKRIDTLHEEMNRRFEAVLERLGNLEANQRIIVDRLDLKDQVTESLARTSLLEKRIDDLWSVISKERPAVK